MDFDSFVSQWGGTCPTQSSNSSLGTGGTVQEEGGGGLYYTELKLKLRYREYSSGEGTCTTQSSN